MRKAMIVVALAGMLAGCAQGVWVRPETTQVEAEQTLSQCGYEATIYTPPSEVHLGGRRTVGRALLEGVLEGVEDGLRQANLRTQCMQAHGFRQVPVAVAAAAAQPRQTRYVQTTISPASPRLIAAVPAAPEAIPLAGPALSAQVIPVTSVPLPPPSARSQPRSMPAMATVRTVFARPDQILVLPPNVAIRQAFLLGACSAGDTTACIVSAAERPRAPTLY